MEWNLEQDFVLRIGEIGRNETRSREPGALIAPCQVVAKFFTSKRFVVRLSFPSLRGRNYESAQTLAKKKLFEKFQRAETKGESRRGAAQEEEQVPWSRLKRTEEKRYVMRSRRWGEERQNPKERSSKRKRDSRTMER